MSEPLFGIREASEPRYYVAFRNDLGDAIHLVPLPTISKAQDYAEEKQMASDIIFSIIEVNNNELTPVMIGEFDQDHLRVVWRSILVQQEKKE